MDDPTRDDPTRDDPTRDPIARLRQRPAADADLSGARPPAPTRDASTVVLLRDGADGIEACLLRRGATLSFAAGMHVFPGGTVDPADVHDGVPWIGPPISEIAHALGADAALTRALVCAAVRETFEESGVLLAGPSATEVVDVSDPSWETDRRALEDHRLSLAVLLTRRGIALRADLLRPWARWVTPVVEPRRYDTRFFVATLPAGQSTRTISHEVDHMGWIRPAAALERHTAGGLPMLPPTAFTLAELAELTTVSSVMAAAAARDLAPVMPRIIITDGEAHHLLPHDEGYNQ